MFKDDFMRPMKTIGFFLIIAFLMGGAFLLLSKSIPVASDESASVTAQYSVQKIEFLENENLFTMPKVYVETPDDILTITVAAAEFVPVSGSDPLTLKQFENRKPGKAEYIFYIPEDQLLDIKRQYARTYSNDLTITELENTPKE